MPALFGALLAVTSTALSAPPKTPDISHFKPRLPSTTQHTEFVVEVNKKGQVTRVRSGKSSHDEGFNTLTYGNVLQVFIRTPDGNAVAGTYRLSYDYDPKTKLVRRSVALLHAGGVNPDAVGAVDQMAEINRRRAQREAQSHPSPGASSLPDLKTITGGH